MSPVKIQSHTSMGIGGIRLHCWSDNKVFLYAWSGKYFLLLGVSLLDWPCNDNRGVI